MSRLPRHLGLIMDGNGRWATSRGMPRTEGHRRGATALDRVIRLCKERGIEWLSIYAFSTENWKRPADEVSQLMALFGFYLRRKAEALRREGIRLVVSGDRSMLPRQLATLIDDAERITAGCSSMTVNVCLNYGGREEIAQAARRLILHGLSNAAAPEAITEQDLSGFMYQPGMPDLDLIIRTSGEQRLSNFMMWQAKDAEFHTTAVHWPDFGAAELDAALEAHARRWQQDLRPATLHREAEMQDG